MDISKKHTLYELLYWMLYEFDMLVEKWNKS